MFTKKSLKIIVALCVLVTSSANIQASQANNSATENTPKKLNYLMISVDDLNDWVGVLQGHPDAVTPNIDRLAKRGMLFTNAHTASPVCNSSRAAAMTGLLPSTTGVYRNGIPSKKIIDKNITINESFQQAGYKTMGVGKLLHTFYYQKGTWDEFYKRFKEPKANKKDIYSIGGEFKGMPLDNEHEDNTMDAKAVDWAIDRLQQKQDKPFFLAVGIYRPHLVWAVPKHFYDDFPADKIQKPQVKPDDLNDVGATGFKWAIKGADQKEGKATSLDNAPHANIVNAGDWGKGLQAYLASIKHADNQVGRLLDALDKSEYADNTAIVLWSDHGWHLGEKHHWRKSTLWEEATRIPFIISVPGLTKAGSQTNQAVSLIDMYPTLVDLANLKQPKKLDGESLKPLLIDPNYDKKSPALTTYYFGNTAVRDDHYRYIKYENGEEELYDHKNDPNEWHNLAQLPEYQTIKKELATWLPKKYAKEFGSKK